MTLLPVTSAQAHPGHVVDPGSIDREAARKSAAEGARSATATTVEEILGAPDAIGIGVVDVEKTKTGMTTATGVDWRPNYPTENAEVLYPNGVVLTLDFDLGISVQGPPYLVLEEVRPALYPWQSLKILPSYHLMYVVPDVAAASAALSAKGLPLLVTASAVPDQDFAVGYAMHAAVNGINVEVIEDDVACPLLDGCQDLIP